MKIEVIQDPTEKQQVAMRVIVDGQLTTPVFNSKGAALAYGDLLRSGVRKPEFVKVTFGEGKRTP